MIRQVVGLNLRKMQKCKNIIQKLPFNVDSNKDIYACKLTILACPLPPNKYNAYDFECFYRPNYILTYENQANTQVNNYFNDLSRVLLPPPFFPQYKKVKKHICAYTTE